MENALRQALRQGELLLHYQPQIDLHSGRPCGMEALVRWQHPELGMVPPGRFIPMAEESGIILELGNWVLEHSCTQLARWRALGLNAGRLAVNISMHQLEKGDLVDEVGTILADLELNATDLELEVTESVLMQRTEQALDTLDGLRRMGIQLAIDDFGTGYSSLAYLRQLPVQRLKIDRSFISDIGNDPGDEAIIRAIISMGTSLGLEIIAEGVENPRQAEFLRRENCHLAQGFMYARPMPAPELEEFLQ